MCFINWWIVLVIKYKCDPEKWSLSTLSEGLFGEWICDFKPNDRADRRRRLMQFWKLFLKMVSQAKFMGLKFGGGRLHPDSAGDRTHFNKSSQSLQSVAINWNVCLVVWKLERIYCTYICIDDRELDRRRTSTHKWRQWLLLRCRRRIHSATRNPSSL